MDDCSWRLYFERIRGHLVPVATKYSGLRAMLVVLRATWKFQQQVPTNLHPPFRTGSLWCDDLTPSHIPQPASGDLCSALGHILRGPVSTKDTATHFFVCPYDLIHHSSAKTCIMGFSIPTRGRCLYSSGRRYAFPSRLIPLLARTSQSHSKRFMGSSLSPHARHVGSLKIIILWSCEFVV